jgi:hypothetical protein
MTIEKMKEAILEKVSVMKPQQIQAIYKLLEETSNGKSDFENWNDIDEEIQLKINSGLEDLAAGRKENAFDFLKKVKNQYGIKA